MLQVVHTLKDDILVLGNVVLVGVVDIIAVLIDDLDEAFESLKLFSGVGRTVNGAKSQIYYLSQLISTNYVYI